MCNCQKNLQMTARSYVCEVNQIFSYNKVKIVHLYARNTKKLIFRVLLTQINLNK